MAFGILGQNSPGILGLDPEELKKRIVWAKGHPIPRADRAVWRTDDHGNILNWFDYGDRNSPYGWEMDHYPIPKSLGGSNAVGNLRPLHCRLNASLGAILGGLIRD